MTTSSRNPTDLRLTYLSGQAIADGEFDKAILPFGATEYHGPHLPYGTDTIAAEALAHAIANELGQSLILPTLSYGISPHHLPWPWTISMRPETMRLTIRDIAKSLLRHDLKKLLIICTHDGNPPIVEAAARELSQDQGMSVALFSGWTTLARELLSDQFDCESDHGGRTEMSIVLHAAPETARPDLAVDRPRGTMGHPVTIFGNFDEDRPAGFSGHASQGSAEEGAAAVEAITNMVVPFLRELDRNGWQRGPWLHEATE